MKTILLPNNTFGAIIMLILVALSAIVPFVLTAWLVTLVAPWWVAGPVALLVSIVCFCKIVKFDK